MTARACAAAVCVALLAGWVVTPSASAEMAVALVLEVHGPVNVQHANARRTEAAAFGRALEQTDVVHVGPAGSVKLFLRTGFIVGLGAGTTVQIGQLQVGPSDKLAAPVSGRVPFIIAGTRESGQTMLTPLFRHVGGGVIMDREHDDFLELTPCATRITTGRPTFSWLGVPAAAQYLLVVTNLSGDQLLYVATGSTTSWAFPPDSAALPDNAWYDWTLVARSGDGRVLARSSCKFEVRIDTVAVQRALAAIAEHSGGPDTPSALYLSGCHLFDLHYFSEAAQRFTALSQRLPDSPVPHRALAQVYDAMDMKQAAERERAAAVRLER